eukprot:6671547-Heterocapsa_arctica.AAC.1
MVPFIEQGLMEYRYDEDQEETEEMTEEEKGIEDGPTSRMEAMIQFGNLEKQMDKLARMLAKENRDQQEPEERAEPDQETNEGAMK